MFTYLFLHKAALCWLNVQERVRRMETQWLEIKGLSQAQRLGRKNQGKGQCCPEAPSKWNRRSWLRKSKKLRNGPGNPTHLRWGSLVGVREDYIKQLFFRWCASQLLTTSSQKKKKS
jgi:hypothetical protein